MDKKIQTILNKSKKMKKLSSLFKDANFHLVVEQTSFLQSNASIKQRLWHIENQTNQVPKCEACGKDVHWYSGKYAKYCGTQCSGSCKNRKKKTIETNLKKYGVENPFANKEVKEKIRTTNLGKYGVQYTQQNAQVRQKSIKTMIEKYGVENPSQSAEIQNKKAENVKKKYGIPHFNQIHFSPHTLESLNNQTWLYQQHYELKRSLNDIAIELGVDITTVSNYLHYHGLETQYHYTKGVYCETYFKQNPWDCNVDAFLYIIQLFDDNEKFIKIGITTRLNQRMYQFPYRVQILLKIPLPLYIAFLVEQTIIGSLDDNNRYIPNDNFGGSSECFKVESYDKIIHSIITLVDKFAYVSDQ